MRACVGWRLDSSEADTGERVSPGKVSGAGPGAASGSAPASMGWRSSEASSSGPRASASPSATVSSSASAPACGSPACSWSSPLRSPSAAAACASASFCFRGGSLRFGFFLGFFVFCFSELLGERDGFLLAQIGVGDGVFASDLFGRGRRGFANIQRMGKRTGRFLPLSFRQGCRCDGFETVSGGGGLVPCAQVCA